MIYKLRGLRDETVRSILSMYFLTSLNCQYIRKNHNWFLLHFSSFALTLNCFMIIIYFYDYKITHTNVHMLITIFKWISQLIILFPLFYQWMRQWWWIYEIWRGHMCCINYKIKIIISLETCLSRLSISHTFYYRVMGVNQFYEVDSAKHIHQWILAMRNKNSLISYGLFFIEKWVVNS